MKTDNVAIVTTSYGGHLSFMEGWLPTRYHFTERLFAQFARSVFQNQAALESMGVHHGTLQEATNYIPQEVNDSLPTGPRNGLPQETPNRPLQEATIDLPRETPKSSPQGTSTSPTEERATTGTAKIKRKFSFKKLKKGVSKMVQEAPSGDLPQEAPNSNLGALETQEASNSPIEKAPSPTDTPKMKRRTFSFKKLKEGVGKKLLK